MELGKMYALVRLRLLADVLFDILCYSRNEVWKQVIGDMLSYAVRIL